jgi:biopolymer transport protein ExbB
VYDPIKFISDGGVIMYAIVALSIVALGLIIERIYSYGKMNADLGAFFKELDAMVAKDGPEEAVAHCRQSPALIAHLAAALLENRAQGPAGVRRSAVTEIDLHYQPFLRKRLDFLATIAKAAPMLGLFGTVQGMIGAFNQLSAKAADPSQLAHNISVALNTTFGGLAVAIPVIFALTYFHGRTRRFDVDLERCSAHVQELVGRLSAGGR